MRPAPDDPWERMEHVLDRLVRQVGARAAFVINRCGLLLACSCSTDDLPPLGKPCRQGTLATQLKQLGTAVEYRDHGRTCLHAQLAGPRMVLLVLCRVSRTRHCARQVHPFIQRAADELKSILDDALLHTGEFFPPHEMLTPLTEQDIDALFGHGEVTHPPW